MHLRVRQRLNFNPAEGRKVASFPEDLRPPALKELLSAPGVVGVLDLDSARHDREIIPVRRGSQCEFIRRRAGPERVGSRRRRK
ncbi:MAG: hypothetical protein BroJett003_16940 [Planctomycetota bacterium]|nr:MAG: hypothetical protein BroJett003_16940 [Planctomycetota bacterium]